MTKIYTYHKLDVNCLINYALIGKLNVNYLYFSDIRVLAIVNFFMLLFVTYRYKCKRKNYCNSTSVMRKGKPSHNELCILQICGKQTY